MAAAATRTRTKAKPAPEPEVEDIDDLELEEAGDDDADEVEDAPAPKKSTKAKAKAAAKDDKPAFGTSELAAHVSEATGKSYDGKAIRVLLRKMAKDGVIERTVGEDRARYSFTGPNDPQVKAIVKAVKAGAIEAEKKAGLDRAKASKEAKAGTKAKAKPAPAEVEDDDVEELDDDE